MDKESKKVLKDLAKQCQVDDYKKSNISDALSAISVMEYQGRLDKKKKYPLVAVKQFLKSVWHWIATYL